MPSPLRVAYTLEQCWHDVPGGSTVASLEVLRRLVGRPGLDVIGVAGRHRERPRPEYRPAVEVRQLPLARPWLYETWNRVGWPRVERATGTVDVCHSTIAVPAPSRAPHVVTVHDVAFVHHPERFSKHGVRVMMRGLDRCRRADLLLVPSASTRDDLVALGLAGDRIRVVPWGVEAREVAPADLARVRATYALPERFVLFVGTVEPRKNLARLAAAVEAIGDDVPLVVAGAPGWGDAPATGPATRFLGFVPDADLAALYAAATVFAYPSLEEGFGMPVLEAMAQGAPVVTSRGSATEEVAGGAAELVDPLDTASIAAGIRAALADRDRLVELGTARAAALTWEASADATERAYRDAAAGGAR